MPILKWNLDRNDSDLVDDIAERAVALAARFGLSFAKGEAIMDVTAVHLNSCPLDLERLAKADDFNFSHDVFGIHRHINSETGELTLCFRPRFAKGDSNG